MLLTGTITTLGPKCQCTLKSHGSGLGSLTLTCLSGTWDDQGKGSQCDKEEQVEYIGGKEKWKANLPPLVAYQSSNQKMV